MSVCDSLLLSLTSNASEEAWDPGILGNSEITKEGHMADSD